MLNIIRAGIYTTVQDAGRGGFRRLGISQGGSVRFTRAEYGEYAGG